MSTRRPVVAYAAGLACALLSTAALAQTELTVIVYGGSFEEGWKKSVIVPFEKANPDIKIKIATGLTQQTIALMRAQKNDVKIDVIMMDEVGAAQGNAEGLYEPLVSAKVPNIEKLYPQFRTKGDAYTKFMYVAQALVWHKDQVKQKPDSWMVLWDPAYKNKIAVPDIATSHGSFFLLTASDMTGGSVKNTDPGFELIGVRSTPSSRSSSRRAKYRCRAGQVIVRKPRWMVARHSVGRYQRRVPTLSTPPSASPRARRRLRLRSSMWTLF